MQCECVGGCWRAIKAQSTITLHVRLPVLLQTNHMLNRCCGRLFWNISEMKTNIKNRVVFRVCTF